MPRKKLKRFAEFREFPNSFEFAEEMKGEWASKYFKNENPIVLELACGKGDYALQLAQMHPERNYIAIDIQGERLWMGAKASIESEIKNLAFLRIYIENLGKYFARDEVDEIWITFPDPHPQKGKAKKRLTSKRFLEIYKKILRKSGTINFKTDHEPLFDFSLETLEECKIEPIKVIRDIYSQKELAPELSIKTYFENKHLKAGKKIFYLQFTL